MKNGFEIRTLGEVCEVIAGQSPPSSTYNFDGRGLPFFQGKADFGSLYPSVRVWCDQPTKVARANDILISVRAPVGPTNLCQIEACIGRGLSAIRPAESANYKYVLYYLRSIESRLSKQGRGSTFSAITQDELRSLKIPFPPLPIQKQIASILEKADAARKKRRQADALTEQFLQSAFLEMFGDPVTNPKGWNVVTVAEISSHISSGSTPLGGESTYLTKGIDFIRSQNVLMNQLDLTNVAHISTRVHNSMKRTWLKSGDVLLNITGASIGRVAFYGGLDNSANVNQHVCIIRPIEVRVVPEYLSFLISMPSYQSRILSRNSGATRQAFNFSQVRSFKIALPPLVEQQKFSALVEKVDSLRTRQRESEKELDNLFNSLMQKAFTGELVKETFAAPVLRTFGLNPTDLHVALLGKIIMAHEARPECKSTLGHVKGEKICHIIENYLDLDLRREPKRMAAGPADFPHLVKVESRAKKTNHFLTVSRYGDEGKKYVPRNLDSFLGDFSNRLGETENEIDRIIHLFVRLKTDRAEVVTTVYAAWNDLLLDGKNPTDEEIIKDARENWTPEKLKIPVESFQGSIDWLRRNNLVPKGRGKHTTNRNS